MSDRQDVQSSLADMDRKLRELQRELAMVSQPPEDVAPAAPPVASVPVPPPPLPPRPAPASPAPAIAPTQAPSGLPPLPADVSRPIAPGAQGPEPAAPADPLPARAGDSPSPAGAQAQVARIVDEAASRVTELGRQVDGLQRLREELQRSMLALQQKYGRAVAPSPSPPPPPPAPTTAVSPSDGHAFEGDVVINAGPFLDIGTLGAFEQALAQLPHTEDVHVRGFEGNRALIDLRLGGPIQLVDEMRRALPFSFGVAEVGNKLLTINVDP